MTCSKCKFPFIDVRLDKENNVVVCPNCLKEYEVTVKEKGENNKQT